MKPRKATLGESIYSKIENNSYLYELYENLLFNYSMHLLGTTSRNKPLNKKHILRFADILSKSYGYPNSEKHKTWSQEIIALMDAIYPNNPMIKAYATSVLSNIGNYRGLQLINTKYKTTSLLDELYQSFDLDYLEIPYQNNKYFFHQQKEIFDHLDDKIFSYSGPTSMGKSLLMRMYIKNKILNGFKCNFVILVPTKALISEISSKIIKEDLKDELANKKYKVLTSGNSLFLKQDGFNYIMVMTPERLLYTLISFQNLIIDYLFIDEAHKISEIDGRAAFYSKVTDMLAQKKTKPHVIFASPNIPNPEVYLKILPNNDIEDNNSLKTSYTPVSQMKYVLDTISHEFKVFNERSISKNPFIKISDLSINETNNTLIEKIINTNKTKSTIVYCSGREKAINFAREISKNLPKLNDEELNFISKEIKDDIHADYFLAELIEKGIAYHVGYLPINIRTKIEDLYRRKKISTIFCTSTLIEGVNLPADNLIVISCRMGGRRNMTRVEFKNLLGRVGRIEYNLYGNVFIIRDSLMSEKTIKDLLVKPVEEQKIALNVGLSVNDKEYIINQFLAGNTQLIKRNDQKNEVYELIRKTASMLLKDIISDRNSVVRQEFESLLTLEKINIIKERFNTDSPDKPKPDDDINVSLDQTELLIKGINNGLEYPKLINGRVDYGDLVNFLYLLRKIFKWDTYDSETLGNGDKIKYYAVILARWMNGYGLNLLLKDTLDYNFEKHGTITINHQPAIYNNSQEHKNIVIGDTLQIIENVILFSIANYFLRFSTEYKRLKTDGLPFDNDWYEYVEYGSTNKLTIFFQRNGLSRDTADYIRQHPEYLKITEHGYKLKKTLLDCKKESIRDEIKDVLFNVPELFV